jgi:hypothetical protein
VERPCEGGLAVALEDSAQLAADRGICRSVAENSVRPANVALPA